MGPKRRSDVTPSIERSLDGDAIGRHSMRLFEDGFAVATMRLSNTAWGRFSENPAAMEQARLCRRWVRDRP